jgi:hypothetical protein
MTTTEGRTTTITELDTLAADTYPHRAEDAATLARHGVDEAVATRVLDYLQVLNDADAATCKRNGYWFARSEVYTVEQPDRPRKLLRLQTLSALTPGEQRRQAGGSVVCFLEIATGRLRQADGWRKAGQRVIADLSTEAGAARLLRH